MMGILNCIATVILIYLISQISDESFARELHDGGFSYDEIGDLLDMSEEEVEEMVGENDHDYNDFYDY